MNMFKGHTRETWRYVVLKGFKEIVPFASTILALLGYRTEAVIVLAILLPLGITVDLSFMRAVRREGIEAVLEERE